MDKRDINPEEQTLMLFALLAFNRIHRSAFVDLRGWKPDCMQAFSLVHYNQPSTNIECTTATTATTATNTTATNTTDAKIIARLFCCLLYRDISNAIW